MSAQCFMVGDTQQVKVSLRRYANGSKCPGPYGYHNASAEIGETAEVTNAEGYLEDLTRFYPHDDAMHTDLRWPTKCDGCDYLFQQEDKWQANQHTIYTDGTNRWIDQDLPPGAIREAWWIGAGHCGPDGKSYLLRLPNGGIDWSIYGPASDSDVHWTITGTLPNITASPSINAEGVWHGWLQNGLLTP